MKLETRFKVFALGTSTFIMIMANTMLFPVLPQMRKALDVGLRDISLLVLFVSLPAAFLSPVGGLLADIWGRKKIIVPSIFIYGAGGGLAGLAILLLEEPFTVILIFRLMQGIGSAAPMYLAVALAGDIFQSQERTRAMGFIETANGLGKVFSPIIGGAVGLLGWYAPFFVYPAVSIPVAIAIWVSIKEPPQQEKISLRSELSTCHKLFNKSIALALFSGLFIILALFGTMFWLGEFLDETIPDGTVVQGLIISLPVAAMAVTVLFTPGFTNRIGARLTLTLGLLLAGASMLAIPFTKGTFLLWPAIALLGFSTGLLLPMLDTVATAVSARGHRGIITTIFGSFRCLGAAVAPYFIATLLGKSLLAAMLPIAALGISMGAATFFFTREEETLPPQLHNGPS